MLVVRALRKVYRPSQRRGAAVVALDGVDLEVPAGAFTSVLGPSGSGKTTLLRCVGGFERPDSGSIVLGGRTLVSPQQFVRPYHRRVGIVPQEGTLFPHLTVAQNIGFGLRGDRRRGRRNRVGELLDLVGLSELGERRPDQLSGGQQQRVALARALAPEPELLLLDEPFSALDAQLRAELREEVRALLRGLGSTVMLVTHDQEEALSLSDHLVVMASGRVMAAGDPRELYDAPSGPELMSFLGDALVIEGTAERAGAGIDVTCALGRLPVSRFHGVEGSCLVLIRPEHLSIAEGDPSGPGRVAADSALPERATPGGSGSGPRSGGAAVTATVVAQSFFGHDALLRVAVAGISQPVPVRVPSRQRLYVGDAVRLSVTGPIATHPRAPSRPDAARKSPH